MGLFDKKEINELEKQMEAQENMMDTKTKEMSAPHELPPLAPPPQKKVECESCKEKKRKMLEVANYLLQELIE